MSNLEMWSLIVGFGLPTLIAVIQQPHWSSRVRACVTAGVCVVAGLVTAYLNGDIPNSPFITTILTSILTIAVAAVSFYKHFWTPLGVTQKVEKATSRTVPKHVKDS